MTDVYGVKLRSPQTGLVQIDPDRVVLVLRAKGTVTLAAYGSGAPGLYHAFVTFPNANEFAIMAFKPVAAGDVSIVGRTRSGTTVTFEIAGLAAATVPYYIFDRPVMDTRSYGINFRNPADQKMIFSSKAPLMQLAQAISWDGAADIALPIPAGTSYAIAMNGDAEIRVSTNEDSTTVPPTYFDTWVGWLNNTAKLTGSTIHTNGAYEVYWSYGQGQGPTPNFYLGSPNSGLSRLLILDVTLCDRFTF